MASPDRFSEIDPATRDIIRFPKIRKIVKRGQTKLDQNRYGPKKVRRAYARRMRFMDDLPERQFTRAINSLEQGRGTVEEFNYTYRRIADFREVPLVEGISALCEKFYSGDYTNVDVILAMKSCEQRFDHEGFEEVRQLIIPLES